MTHGFSFPSLSDEQYIERTLALLLHGVYSVGTGNAGLIGLIRAGEMFPSLHADFTNRAGTTDFALRVP